MGSLEALALVNSLMSLAVNVMLESQRVSNMLMQMQAEGRTVFTPAEQAELIRVRDVALKDLADALK